MSFRNVSFFPIYERLHSSVLCIFLSNFFFKYEIVLNNKRNELNELRQLLCQFTAQNAKFLYTHTQKSNMWLNKYTSQVIKHKVEHTTNHNFCILEQ